MMTFKTLSGATYTVDQGRITREQGRTPIYGWDPRAHGETVVLRPFRWVTEPEVGQRAAYVLLDSEGRDIDIVRTAMVVEIEVDA